MKKTLFSMLAATILLSGCAYKSKNVSSEGTIQTEDSLVFPDPNNAWITGGTYKNLDTINVVRKGMTKVQVQKLIGHPHFNETFFIPKEWDYLFNVVMEDKSIKVCQFKVLFDSDKRVGSTHWKPKDCVEKITKVENKIVIQSDALFDFDEFELSDTGLEAIDMFVNSLPKDTKLTIIGYTDPIGPEDYNLNLSQKRANSVFDYLKTKGFTNMEAIGKGEENQVVLCDKTKDGPSFIKCLKPNRRVEIIAK